MEEVEDFEKDFVKTSTRQICNFWFEKLEYVAYSCTILCVRKRRIEVKKSKIACLAVVFVPLPCLAAALGPLACLASVLVPLACLTAALGPLACLAAELDPLALT